MTPPAPKKRRLNSGSVHFPKNDKYALHLASEIDLEISLKQRLAKTLKSRITWALLLQESLRTHGDLEKDAITSVPPFRDAALEALDAADAPCNIILNRDINTVSTNEGLAPALLESTTSRHVVNHHRRPPRQLERPKSKPTFLYTRFPGIPETIVILMCPDCKRTSFTALQGLLNHARLRHQKEFTSHDDCIAECAVPMTSNDETKTIDLEGGVEVGGANAIRPGLRRIFEMAVGSDLSYSPVRKEETTATGNEANERREESAHITRTLGHHKDSPALAPFLGRTPKRRGINVYEETFVDINGFEEHKIRWRSKIPTLGLISSSMDMEQSGHTMVEGEVQLIDPSDTMSRESPLDFQSKRDHRRIWRMPYSHRNIARPEIETAFQDLATGFQESEQISNQDAKIVSSELTSTDAATTDVHPESAGSRFHVVARVIVADHSLWIPFERRADTNKDLTHQWMISVTSPSYSLDITSILAQISVTSLSHPEAFPPLITNEPPFVVFGRSAEPFVARVELLFAGTSKGDGRDQKMVLEHWIELDLVKGAAPVLGDEQVVDVELDRSTILLPVKTNYVSAMSRSLWDRPQGSTSRSALAVPECQEDGHSADNADYYYLLKTLLPKFPMTLKDVKGRPPQSMHRHHFNANVPYKLVTTPMQFQNLVPGRRKAIEWGRAKALRDAYTEAVRAEGRDGLLPLSTADVFAWLDAEGHFIRARPSPSPTISTSRPGPPENSPKLAEEWCHICGLRLHLHTVVRIKREPSPFGELNARGVSPQKAKIPYTCALVSDQMHIARAPIFDVTRLLPRSLPDPGRNTVLNSDSGNMKDGLPAEPMVPKSLVRTTKTTIGTRSKLWCDCNLIAIADPRLILAMRRVVNSLNLPSFSSASTPDRPSPVVPVKERGLTDAAQDSYPLVQLGSTLQEVDATLAPYALLSALTNVFVKRLIIGGVGIAKKDKEMLLKTNEHSKGMRVGTMVLTPAHILRGLTVSDRLSDGANGLLLLSRVGVKVAENVSQ